MNEPGVAMPRLARSTTPELIHLWAVHCTSQYLLGFLVE